MIFNRALILLITVIVAFCSIAYELVYAQALTISFGGQVERYSITIGLFLLGFGLGALVYSKLNITKLVRNFIAVEALLSFIGPVGLFAIIYLNSASIPFFYTEEGKILLITISHIPILVVGILSGIELPLLSDLNNRKEFAYSETLGFDYIGSLLGTVVYALYMFPNFGIIETVIIIGFLNSIASIIFIANTYKIGKELKIRTVVGVTITLQCLFVLAFFNMEKIENETQKIYYSKAIKDINWSFGEMTDEIEINEVKRTRYQEIITYEKHNFATKVSDKCFNLDKNVQMCESWVDIYHKGLIDIPMMFFSEDSYDGLEVLLIGGGDWIPANYLRKYNVNIDMVDIDEKFIEFTKTSELLKPYHNDSYNYEKLNLIISDGYNYIKNTDKKYDFIILDLPGLNDSKLNHLYSIELFSFVRNTLKENGIALTWFYYQDKPQNKILMKTLFEAGFKEKVDYFSYTDKNLTQERFIALSKSNKYEILSPNKYFEKHREKYIETLKISKIENYEDIKPNSIFKPNTEITINAEPEYLENYFDDVYRGMFPDKFR